MAQAQTKDYSANKPALPNVGANFAAAGPYASYVLVATIPVNGNRCGIAIENTSGGQIAVVIDDGVAQNAQAPANASVFALAAGAAAGSQGGSWQSTVEKGRIQIYSGTATPQIMIREY